MWVQKTDEDSAEHLRFGRRPSTWYLEVSNNQAPIPKRWAFQSRRGLCCRREGDNKSLWKKKMALHCAFRCFFLQLEQHLSATHVSLALLRKQRCIINLKWQKMMLINYTSRRREGGRERGREGGREGRGETEGKRGKKQTRRLAPKPRGMRASVYWSPEPRREGRERRRGEGAK